MATRSYSRAVNTAPHYGDQLRNFTVGALLTLFGSLLLIVFLMPMLNMFLTALQSEEQMVVSGRGPILPVSPEVFHYEGSDYPLYQVPDPAGIMHQWALVTKGRQVSEFVDPARPEAGVFPWEGNWRQLEPVFYLNPQWSNFQEAWETIDFPQLFGNTLFIAITGSVGTLLASISVAYAFTRFPLPAKNILFIILLGTIILPSQVTLIPTYAFFSRIGWIGDLGWLPLIVPHFFSNAYNVFLLRQYFLTLPRELDEAAMIDGANPFRILVSVILPQSWPVITTVGLFHFIFAWNDYFNPLIYTLGAPHRYVISIGVQVFNFRYDSHPELVQATSMMALILPVVIFFFAQKAFMRGVVITGVEK
jgi:multiple sugar transport system permease protein